MHAQTTNEPIRSPVTAPMGGRADYLWTADSGGIRLVVEETDAVSPAVAAALGGAPMLRRLAPRCLVLLAVVVLLVPACTDNADDDAAVNASTTTTTTLPSTTTVTEQAESDAGPFPLGEPVDLLIMSDSSGIGVAERYAPLAAEALDREIRVHDWARGGEPITVILDWIQTTLADEVAEAEIIVVYLSLIHISEPTRPMKESRVADRG